MERPAKKLRLQGPDGFQKPKPTSRYKPPESITKFVSTFDDTIEPVALSKSSPRKEPVSVAVHDRVRNPFVDFDVPKEPEAGPSRPSVSIPKGQVKPASLVHPPPAAKADKPLPPLKVLKPPVFLPPATVPSNKKEGVTLRSLQPTLKPPPAPLEKPKFILKPPPAPLPSSTNPPVPLKPLPPPPAPEQRPASPKRQMKTIFTTGVAQATDPTKEGSGAELLSLFLQQHGHNFTSLTDRELQRGVMVSPDKCSRSKDPKFIRGGLAERFQHRIACTKTDFVLWRRQMEQKIESGTKLRSDMQLRIMRVLDMAKPSARLRFATGPRAGLALCRLARCHPLAGGDLTLGTYVVVFHFAPTNGGRSAVSSVDRFEEGSDVMVWLPWHKVELVGAEGCAKLLEMFRTLDVLTPPHNLLVVSKFCIVVPKPPPSCSPSQ